MNITNVVFEDGCVMLTITGIAHRVILDSHRDNMAVLHKFNKTLNVDELISRKQTALIDGEFQYANMLDAQFIKLSKQL